MRFLKWLGILVLVLAVGGWFATRWLIETAAQAWFDDRVAQGMTAERSGMSVGGFPASWTLAITDLKLADPVGGTGWQVPELRLRAATWAPWHLTAEIAPDQVVTLPDQRVTVASDRLVATLGSAADPNLPLREATVRATRLDLQSDLGWTLGLSDAEVTFLADDTRPPGAYVLDFDLAPLRPDPAFVAALAAVALPGLPAPDFPAEVEQARGRIGLRYTAPLDRHSAGTQPQLDVIEVSEANFAWGALALHAEGLLEADAQGYASGRILLELTNWDRLPALLVAAGAVKPEIAPTIANGLKALAAQSPDPAVLVLGLDMAEGRMSLGPFPLGEAPRLRAPQS